MGDLRSVPVGGTPWEVLAAEAGALRRELTDLRSTALARVGGGGATVGASVNRVGPQTIANATDTAIDWTSELWDTDTIHDNVVNPSRLTVPTGQDGKWLWSSSVLLTPHATGARRFSVRVNGTRRHAIYNEPGAANYRPLQLAVVLDLSSGDYVQAYVEHSAGTNLNADDAGLGSPYMFAQLVRIGA